MGLNTFNRFANINLISALYLMGITLLNLFFFYPLYLVIVGKTIRNYDRYTTPGSELRRTMTSSEFHVLLTLMKLQCSGWMWSFKS